MKTVEEKTSPAAQNQVQMGRTPFFTKEGQDPFFPKTNGTPNSFFSPNTIQSKLTVGQPNDKYEVEADNMADKVVQRLNGKTSLSSHKGGQGNTVQAKCAECEQEDEKLQKKEEPLADAITSVQRKPIFESNEEQPEQQVQTKPDIQAKCAECEQEEKLQTKTENTLSSKASPGIENQLNSSKGSGSPLSPEVGRSMGNAFGADFSSVKVHTDSTAVQMNKELGAQAFTHGNDIYFNEGKYNPEATSGKHLLAHELTHTIQQSKDQPKAQRKNNSDRGESGYEVEDVIHNIQLALSIAENSILDESIDAARRAKIEGLYLNLRGVLFQLYNSRGTDGSDIVLNFDPNPQLHEINPGDANKSVEELYYPFSVMRGSRSGQSSSSSSRLQAKLTDSISTVSQSVIQRFCDPLICVGIIVLGGLLLAGCSRSSSGSIGPARLRTAISNFDSNNSSLTTAERVKIHSAMSGAVGTNDHLLISFYDYYSNKNIVKDASLTGTGTYAETEPNSDTRVDPTILSAGFSENTLGGLLIHEYTHTRHHTNFMGSRDYEEGDSYGIEYFFAERNGDTSRTATISAILSSPTSIVSGSQVAAFKSYFCKSYGTMKVLYEIIDTGHTSHSSSPILSGLTRDRARELTTELISKKEEDHSSDLTSIIGWVITNHSSLGIPISCR